MTEKIYLLVSFDSILEGNKYNKIDLENYELEYLVVEKERISAWQDAMESGIPSLCIQVKLKNKKTNKIEWAETFYKSLKNYSLEDIYNLSLEDKKIFILKKENPITGKKYAKSEVGASNDFYKELDHVVDGFGYPNIVMPKILTKEAKSNIETALFLYLEKSLNIVDQKSDIDNYPKHK